MHKRNCSTSTAFIHCQAMIALFRTGPLRLKRALTRWRRAPGDALLESTLTNIRDGQPGLDVIRAALNRGVAVVSANKGPLVVAYAELAALAARPGGPGLRFSACVGGYLPSVNIGRRDL